MKMADTGDKIKHLQEMRSGAEREAVEKRLRSGNNGGNGGGPPMDDMPERVKDLEGKVGEIRESLVRMEGKFDTMNARIDSIDRHGATKADLSSLESTLIKWFVGTAFTMVGLATAIAFTAARLTAA